MNINRRSIITGLISFVAAPAIVRVESLMKIHKPIISMRLITEYNPADCMVTMIDILYGRLEIKPEWMLISDNHHKIYYDGDKMIREWIDPKDIYID